MVAQRGRHVAKLADGARMRVRRVGGGGFR
jgi:hypothetical protein